MWTGKVITHLAICRGWSMDEVCAFCIFLGSSGQLCAVPADEVMHMQTYSHYARTIPECINLMEQIHVFITSVLKLTVFKSQVLARKTHDGRDAS